MAAKKTKPDKPKAAPKVRDRGQGKGKLRGKMPTKRSINLMIVNENRINPLAALLGIVLILVLAAAFSKFLVIDRLEAMSAAEARVNRVRNDLDSTMDALDNIGDVSQTYAHYTLEDMTAAELGLVDRVSVLKLVNSIIPDVDEGPTESELTALLNALFRVSPFTGNDALDKAREQSRLEALEQLVPVPEYVVNRWSLTENLLTIEVKGQTLERLNLLGQQIEQSAIVNNCTIVTANRDARRVELEDVTARFIVYLQPATGDGMIEAAPVDEEKKSLLSDFAKVTQFVGGEVSQP